MLRKIWPGNRLRTKTTRQLSIWSSSSKKIIKESSKSTIRRGSRVTVWAETQKALSSIKSDFKSLEIKQKNHKNFIPLSCLYHLMGTQLTCINSNSCPPLVSKPKREHSATKGWKGWRNKLAIGTVSLEHLKSKQCLIPSLVNLLRLLAKINKCFLRSL